MVDQPTPPNSPSGEPARDQEGDRRAKLDRMRNEFGVDPYGQRTDGLISLEVARDTYDEAADQAHREHGKEESFTDGRPAVRVAGRVMAHRVMGNLIFIKLRDQTDASGDGLQIAVSKKAVTPEAFKIAKMIDLGDIVTASGPLAKTNKGEITVWAERTEAPESAETPHVTDPGFAILCKSLTPAVAKFDGHALSDKEQRYRRRYIDLFANPDVMQTMLMRSHLLKATRDFLEARQFVEVETPMMQPIPGGAAARPFTTHHNALDIDLFLRIAPELYLKRLLVGGMPRVYEINRNFRNEGVDRSHNPEFTMLELYEAYGDLYSIMDLVEQLFQTLAASLKQQAEQDASDLTMPFGDLSIDYGTFHRLKYLDLFETHNGFPSTDVEKLHAKAESLGIQTVIEGVQRDHDLILNDVWEETVEQHLVQPTFVIDYPATLCPLTKRKPDEPAIAERFELFVANMELANAYTELNDPDVQLANFQQQVAGEDDESAQFRNVDMDFVEALKVGMPPAGGLGIGIDRMVMLLTNSQSIRDVILFPLMRPESTD